MKKYIIAGAIGFIAHAVWIIGGILLLDYESFWNIARFYGETIDQKSIPTAFLYAFLISTVFAGIFRAMLIQTARYNKKQKWLLGLASGIGFHLAFWALIAVFWLTFRNFWN